MRTPPPRRISLKAVVAELFGTALFVYSAIGCATTMGGSLTWNYTQSDFIAANPGLGTADPQLARLQKDVFINGSWALSTAFAFGMGVLVMAYAVGGISGAVSWL
jgi:glycerol uptake facilitator-like aquaporin